MAAAAAQGDRAGGAGPRSHAPPGAVAPCAPLGKGTAPPPPRPGLRGPMTTDAVRHPPKNRPASVTLGDPVSALGLTELWAFGVRKGGCMCNRGCRSCMHACGCHSQTVVCKRGVCTRGAAWTVHVGVCALSCAFCAGVSTRVAASGSVASEIARNPDIQRCFAEVQYSAWLCLRVNECECLECAWGSVCAGVWYESPCRGQKLEI